MLHLGDAFLFSQAFVGGGYRLGAAPEEESAYVAGERHDSNSQQDVSTDPASFC